MKLELYHKPSCPYCKKVRDYLGANGITVPLKDTSADPKTRAELVAIGGKPQVPCLIIDGKALYESDDIITWFKINAPKK